jgi:SAM-dependent methyltransferase
MLLRLTAMTSALASLIPASLRRSLTFYARYHGRRYECPFCGSRMRALAPCGEDFPVLREKQVIGGGRRDNGLCPVCEALDRERLVLLYLRHKTALFTSPTRVLHFAPEPQLRKHIAPFRNVDYVTADRDYPDVDVNIDICAIPYANASFDAVICNHVLEHIPDDHQAMSELYRVLRPGGWAILQVPLSYTMPSTFEDPSIDTDAGRERAFGQHDHVRIYAIDYADRLRRAGFSVEIFDWTKAGDAFGGADNRHALIREEKLFVATKPKG